MKIYIFSNKEELGESAAFHAANIIRDAIIDKGEANIILATGTSQFGTLDNLVKSTEIDWSRVIMFHLDEYIGIPITHPASFGKYLKDRFVDKITSLRSFYFINGDTENPEQECKRLNKIMAEHPVDVALIGIGENGHIAFNDPPADFDTEEPYIIVDLDKKCRQQQVGEGWFSSIDDVPGQAISMTVNHIMKSRNIIVSVPDKRKANAVKNALEGEITNMCPASILQKHSNCKIFLDKPAAFSLSRKKSNNNSNSVINKKVNIR